MNIKLSLVTLLILFVSTGIEAAVTVPLTVEDMYASSKNVIHGEVVEQHDGAYKNQFYTISTISVTDNYKGEKVGAEIDVINVGGSIGPLSSQAGGMATLAKGEEVIVFLSDKPENNVDKSAKNVDPSSPFVSNQMIMGGMQGKFIVSRDVTETAIGNKTVSSQKKVILRGGNGKQLKTEGAPTLEQFTKSLRTLEARMSSKSNLKTKSVPFLGEIKTLPRQTDLADFRHFDPEHLKMAEKYAKSEYGKKQLAEKAAVSVQLNQVPATAPEEKTATIQVPTDAAKAATK